MRYSSIKFRSGSYIGTPLVYEIAIDDGDDVKLNHGGDLSMYTLKAVEENGMRLYAMGIEQIARPLVYKLFIPETHHYFNAGILIKRSTELKGYSKGGYRVSELLYEVYRDILKRNLKKI